MKLLKKGINAAFDYGKLPKVIDKLYHEIMTEVSFEKRILARDLLQNYFVQPDNSNRRIDKQSGAFIISGLSKNKKEIEEKKAKLKLLKQCDLPPEAEQIIDRLLEI